VIERQPDLIIGSWRGKKSGPTGLSRARVLRSFPLCRQDIYEIKSPLILQPGPAALTDGLAALQRIIGG
jgi:iron complex transport system substrate-binding protein